MSAKPIRFTTPHVYDNLQDIIDEIGELKVIRIINSLDRNGCFPIKKKITVVCGFQHFAREFKKQSDSTMLWAIREELDKLFGVDKNGNPIER